MRWVRAFGYACCGSSTPLKCISVVLVRGALSQRDTISQGTDVFALSGVLFAFLRRSIFVSAVFYLRVCGVLFSFLRHSISVSRLPGLDLRESRAHGGVHERLAPRTVDDGRIRQIDGVPEKEEESKFVFV